MRLFSMAALVLLLVLPSATARAQDGSYASTVEAARSELRRGRLQAARVQFEEVVAGEEEARKEDRPAPADLVAGLLGLAECDRRVGEYAKARDHAEHALKVDPASADATLVLARLEAIVGQYDAAITRLRQGVAAAGARADLRLELALLLQETGKRDEAKGTFQSLSVPDVSVSGKAGTDPRGTLVMAKALEQLGRYEEASRAFLAASRLDKEAAEPLIGLGRLYFRVYGEADTSIGGRTLPTAESQLKKVLQQNGDVEEALLWLYRSRRVNLFLDDGQRTEGFLRTLLDQNPRSVEGLTEQVKSLIEDRRFEEAAELLKKTLAINPNHKRALSHRAALAWITHEADHEEWRGKVLKVDPAFAEVDVVLGDHLVALYRFEDAIPFYQRALEQDDKLVAALDGLGKASIYAARPDARQYLDKAARMEAGFAAPWRHNALEVSRRVEEEYRKLVVGNFTLFLHPEEAEVLRTYLLPHYEEAWTTLSRKYGYVPPGPVRVETFHEFGDFSVRTIGFRGFSALGACFGRFITAVSPVAPELRGQFSWAATAWHEFAHVITLGVSRHRVPRWLTEGLSVYEEKCKDPAWDRGMERDLLDAAHNGEVFPIHLLNTAFRGPRILFGYYQGGLIVEMLTRDFGFAKVVEMLKQYGEDKAAPAILKDVFGLSNEAFDQRFAEFVQLKLKGMKVRPRSNPRKVVALQDAVRRNKEDLLSRLKLGWAFLDQRNTVDCGVQLSEVLGRKPDHPGALLLKGELLRQRGSQEEALALMEKAFAGGEDEFFARLMCAQLQLKRGDQELAKAHLEAAKKCWPTCTDAANSPHVLLAALYREADEEDQAMAELTQFVGFAGRVLEPRLQLAQWHKDKDEWEQVVKWLEQANRIDPFDRALHLDLAEGYSTLSRKAEAARELRVAVAVSPDLDRELGKKPVAERPKRADASEVEFRASTRVRLARLLIELKETDEARKELDRVLEESPDSEHGRAAKELREKLK